MSTSTITTPAVPLPRYPVLLSGLDVLERGPDEIQIGLDPRHGVVITDLPDAVVGRLRRLDGQQSVDTILLAESEHREQLRTVLTQLTALGLVTEAEPASHSPRRGAETGLWSLRARHHQTALTERRRNSAMAVHGDGRLAVATAVLLANAGVGHIDVRMSGTVIEQDLGSGFTETELGKPRRTALADVVHRVDARTRTTRLTSIRGPELVLLTDAVVPAPEVVDELMTAGTPHLPVRVRDGTGIVGPLVVPGRSSCLHCADLHRTDLEPCWPRVASQLIRHDQHPDLGAVQATAALGVAQAMRLLSPSETAPPVWNATLEIDAFEGKVRRRVWVPHPRCGCGASAIRHPA
ncbi:TOMM precursor leader peptide-binding protein [Amycolatopsis sp. NPDC058986]|uniref:TOMM precursor leader peptide-binding protein n=1 Tax=unclassified Amycolatopsis TaxID=2618356 RepID=UPI003670E7C2